MRDILRYGIWLIVATLWCAVCFLAPDFVDSPMEDWPSRMIILGYIMALSGGTLTLLYLLSINRYVCCVLLPLYGALGAAVSYYRVAYHATVTPMVIEATLHTNAGTVSAMVSWQLFVWIAVNIAFAGGLAWYRYRHITVHKPWVQLLMAVILLIGYHECDDRLKQSLNQRYPYNITHSMAEYLRQNRASNVERQLLVTTAEQVPDSIDIVVVLGEALRADHLSMNGYERATTPRLQQRQGLWSLPQVYSPHTYTSISIPYMLTPADSLHPEYAQTHHSFIEQLKAHAFRTAWLSNQDMGVTYAPFIHEADTMIFPNAQKSVFVFDPWYDEQLLPHLDSLMAHGAARNLYVLHSIGSHWYYNNHVPPMWQVFQPLTTNRIVTHNTPEEVTNAYDNTALYMDYVMDTLIERFAERCAVVIYVADHGESLGEEGRWLHAGDTPPMHRPAAFVWCSQKYQATFPEKIQALEAQHMLPCGTDFLFPAVLQAAGIATK